MASEIDQDELRAYLREMLKFLPEGKYCPESHSRVVLYTPLFEEAFRAFCEARKDWRLRTVIRRFQNTPAINHAIRDRG
ncbi:hypothetical protein CHUAL_002592 [Chamberlinius hualienensis]